MSRRPASRTFGGPPPSAATDRWGVATPFLLMAAAIVLAAASGKGGEAQAFRLVPARDVDTLERVGRFYPQATSGQTLASADTLGWLLAPEERVSLDRLRSGENLSRSERRTHLDRIAHLLPEDLRASLSKPAPASPSASSLRQLRDQVDQREKEAQRLQSAYLNAADPAEREKLREELQRAESALSSARRNRDKSILQLESDAPTTSPTLTPELHRRLDSLLERALLRAPAALEFVGYEQEGEGFRLFLSRDIPHTWTVVDCPKTGLPASLHGKTLRHAVGDFYTEIRHVDIDRCRIVTSGQLPTSLHGESFEVKGEGSGSLLNRLLAWRVEKVN